MKKLMLSIASAMMVGAVANAADWFNGGIETGWPEATSMQGGSWTNVDGGSYADSKVTVSADAETPLTFEATTNKTLTSEKPTISAELGFTAFSSPAELPEVPAEAKAGVIVCGEYFYVIAKDPNGATNVWTKTTIDGSASATVNVTFIETDKVEYDIGGSKVTNAVVAASSVQRVRMAGDGSISSLSATSETRGPQTPATGGGSVEKVAENVYEATPSPEGNITIVDGSLKDTDTILITVTNDVQVTGVPANQIKVAFNDAVISNSVFVGGSPFSTKLSESGSAVFPTASGTETIQVKPQLSSTGDAVEPFVVGEDAAVGVKTIPGLTYKLVRYSEIGTQDKVVDSATASGTRTELKDEDKPAGKAFYIIEVTK